MNLNDIIKEIAERTDNSQTEVRKMYDALTDITQEQLLKKDVTSFTLHKLAVFTKTYKEATTGKNPATGENIEISARYRLNAKPNSSLKEAVKFS